MARRAVSASEHDEQAAFFQWWAVYARSKGLPAQLCFAVPNSNKIGHMAKNRFALDAYMKAEGLTPGVADIVMLIARGMWHGLVIEMKVTNRRSKISAVQLEFLNAAYDGGYLSQIGFGFDGAREIAARYLEGRADSD